MWMEKPACEIFFCLFHHFYQYQALEPLKAASNVVIAFTWLKSLILWCWYFQKGMGEKDGCVKIQLSPFDCVLSYLGQSSGNSS